MDILALLNSLVAQLQDLQLKLADAQVALEAEKKLSYDLGFADGVASVVVDPEKKFSQADLDNAVAVAVAALKADLLAKFKAQQEQESLGEKEIEALLS